MAGLFLIGSLATTLGIHLRGLSYL